MATSTLKKTTPADIGAVAKTGDTITGPLKTNSDIILTSGNIYGSDENDANHGIKLGHSNENHMQFFEYGGVYTFYKSVNGVNTGLFQIKDGASGAPLRVDNGGTGATTPAGALANLGAVAKAGDTMTGNLTVQNTGYETNINIRKNTRGIKLAVDASGACGALYVNDDGDGNWVWVVNSGENTINHKGKWDGIAVDITHGGTGAATAAGARANLGFLYDTWASKSTNIVSGWNASFLSSGNAIVEYLPDGILHIVVQGISTKNSNDWILNLKSQYLNFSTTEDAYFTYYLGNTQHICHVSQTGFLYFPDLNTTSLLSVNISIAVG